MPAPETPSSAEAKAGRRKWRSLPGGTRSLLVSTVVVVVVLVVGISLVLFGENAEVRSVGMELFKLGGQVVVVAAAGGFLVQEYNRRRAREAAVNEFRRRILNDLIGAYGKAKRVRRALRARFRRAAPESERRILASDYEAQIERLGDAQLELEMIVHQLNTFFDSFSERGAIRNHIVKMQDYLDRITDEYENVSAERGATGSFSLDELEVLREFLTTHRNSAFRERFTRRFQAALELIQAERVPLG